MLVMLLSISGTKGLVVRAGASAIFPLCDLWSLMFMFFLQIVFSEAWWIGSKEENPEELQLEFPKDMKGVSFLNQICRLLGLT